MYNNPQYIVTTNIDISDLGKIESALSESEQKFNSIAEQSTEGIIIINKKGNFIFINKTFSQMLGYNKVELLNMSIFDIRKGLNEKDKDLFRNISAIKYPIVIELVNRRKDNSTFISKILSKPNKIGSENYRLGITIDITKLKKMEESLRISEEKFKRLFDKNYDTILIFDEKRIVDCNQSALDMFGYTKKEELLNKHPIQLSPDKQPDGEFSFKKAEKVMKFILPRVGNILNGYSNAQMVKNFQLKFGLQ